MCQVLIAATLPCFNNSPSITSRHNASGAKYRSITSRHKASGAKYRSITSRHKASGVNYRSITSPTSPTRLTQGASQQQISSINGAWAWRSPGKLARKRPEIRRRLTAEARHQKRGHISIGSASPVLFFYSDQGPSRS